MTDTLDVRDLQEELDDLTPERERYGEFLDNTDENISDNTKAAAMALLDWDETREERFQMLTAVLDEVTEDNSPLIPEDEWVEYVEELVKETGDMPRNIPSYIEIDWVATANNVQADYSQLEFDGRTYLYRNC